MCRCAGAGGDFPRSRTWHCDQLCCAGRRRISDETRRSCRSTTSASATTARPPALEDVSFDLWPGERVAIVGPNGAGKSTLLKVVAGILAPSNGRADVYGYGAGGHICIGYVPQRSQVDWNFPVTVADVVHDGPRREDRPPSPGRPRAIGSWCAERFAQVGMEQFARRQIGELSGGQQQRVFIARALAQEAELLLMDEPLTGLDIPSQEAIFDILDLLKQRGMTVLVSTHDLQLAADQFDRLMLLQRRLLGFGRPAEVLTPENLQPGVRLPPDRACRGPKGMLALGTPAARARAMIDLLLSPLQYEFMVRGLLAAVTVGIVCAVLGTYVVLRGMAFFGDALAHAILPGVAVAYLIGGGSQGPLFWGGLVAGIGTALGIGAISKSGQIREDTAIGVHLRRHVCAGRRADLHRPQLQRRPDPLHVRQRAGRVDRRTSC